MARVYQMMGSKSPEILRNAMAAGLVTGGNSTNVSHAFGGFSATNTAGTAGVAVTWRNTDTDLTPIVQVAALGTGTAAANARFAVVTAVGVSSAAICCFTGAGGTAPGTAQVMVAVFGQARNDFKTT